MSAQQRAAYVRAALQAIGYGILMFLTVYQTSGNVEDAAIAGGIAILSALGIRGVVEGQFDARRAATGDVRRGDVGSGPVRG